MSFSGKVALVAGAGGGMGLQIARDLIGEGAHVTLVDLKDAPSDIPSGPGSSRYLQGDVTNEDFVAQAVAETIKAHGRLDHLVNTTGVLWFDRDKSCVDMDMDVWDRVMEINVKSFALTARHAVPEMKKAGGGSMVHFASTDALRGDDKPQDAYGCSKAAVVRLSKSLAVQFAKDGIRSNTILPGPVHTPMQARWDGNAEIQAAIANHVPIGRIGKAQDMANACLFLLSDKASYVTGTELIVDGGLAALP
jgi:NAD(P)-dependent dehydrogenase (short-subunit alcohol dehydrogenase family)